MSHKSGSVVKSQMPGGKIPSMTGSHGIYDKGNAPFDKPHDTGNGGIPLKFREDHGVKAASASFVGGAKNAALSYGTGSQSQRGGSSRPVAKASPPSNRK